MEQHEVNSSHPASNVFFFCPFIRWSVKRNQRKKAVSKRQSQCCWRTSRSVVNIETLFKQQQLLPTDDYYCYLFPITFYLYYQYFKVIFTGEFNLRMTWFSCFHYWCYLNTCSYTCYKCFIPIFEHYLL